MGNKDLMIEIIENGWLLKTCASTKFFSNPNELMKAAKDLIVSEE